MARLREGRGRWAIAGVLAVALAAAVIVAWPLVQRYTGAAPPAQFYGNAGLDPVLAQRSTRVLGVAHNAGNNTGPSDTHHLLPCSGRVAARTMHRPSHRDRPCATARSAHVLGAPGCDLVAEHAGGLLV